MKKILFTIFFAVFFSNVVTAQTPGVSIAPTFQVIDGSPSAVGAYYRKVITPNSSVNSGFTAATG